MTQFIETRNVTDLAIDAMHRVSDALKQAGIKVVNFGPTPDQVQTDKSQNQVVSLRATIEVPIPKEAEK